ncbi:hypothetical protein A8F18_35675 [Burkholderia cenocepacia]|nr:hypothetical protein A8F18_35675 [Burkholderia cenocepacia]
MRAACPTPPSFAGFCAAQARRLRHPRARHPADSIFLPTGAALRAVLCAAVPHRNAGFLNERAT